VVGRESVPDRRLKDLYDILERSFDACSDVFETSQLSILLSQGM